MEQAPVKEMTPGLTDNGDRTKLNNNTYVFSKPGEYYLAYVADAGQTIEIDLAGGADYKMDIIDTWNMSITDRRSAEPGKFKFKTVSPYTLLRFVIDKK
jgi:hypothetical protein